MEVVRQLLIFENNLSGEGIILLATKLAEKPRSLDEHVTWYKIGQWESGDTRHPIWYPSSDFSEDRKTRKEVTLFQVLTFQTPIIVQ